MCSVTSGKKKLLFLKPSHDDVLGVDHCCCYCCLPLIQSEYNFNSISFSILKVVLENFKQLRIIKRGCFKRMGKKLEQIILFRNFFNNKSAMCEQQLDDFPF